MDANSWLWLALLVFLVFCCGSMLFMGRRERHSSAKHGRDDDRQSSDRL